MREAEFVAPAEFRAYYERLANGYAAGVRTAQAEGDIDASYNPEVIGYLYTGLGNFIGMRWAEWTGGGRVARRGARRPLAGACQGPTPGWARCPVAPDDHGSYRLNA